MIHKIYSISFSAFGRDITIFSDSKKIICIESGIVTNFSKNIKLLDMAKKQFLEFFNGERQKFNLLCNFSNLTEHQKKVFTETSKIPYGTTTTYKLIAKKINSSPLAVGNALAKNPFPYIVPCHRVIKTNGSIGGFMGSTEPEQTKLKQNLLKFEQLIVKEKIQKNE